MPDEPEVRFYECFSCFHVGPKTDFTGPEDRCPNTECGKEACVFPYWRLKCKACGEIRTVQEVLGEEIFKDTDGDDHPSLYLTDPDTLAEMLGCPECEGKEFEVIDNPAQAA